MKKQKNIVIIPARGGSKRLPRKNVLLLNELPLIVHTINYAKANSDIIDTIVVSTDDEEIKSVAIENGVQVIERPKSLSGDKEPTVTALKHVVENINDHFDNVILLQATNPLRPKDLLTKAFEIYENSDTDSLMTVTRSYEKLGKIVQNKFQPFNYTIGQRSQDLEPLYYENGLLYITKTALIKTKKIVGDNCIPFVVDHPYSKIDIDTKEDLIFAQHMLKNYNE